MPHVRVALALLLAWPTGVVAGKSSAELLARARALYEDMEFEKVLPVAEAALRRGDITLGQRLELYELQAFALAVSGDPLAAEQPFRFLLRANPEFDLPADASPRVLRVLRKVQAEERALAEQLREQRRNAVLETLQIEGEVPAQAVGGRPLGVALRLRDPRGAVASFHLEYRRAGDTDFSSLALKRREDGTWLGAIPAEWTASETGFDLEYFLTTESTDGERLLQLGDASAPRTARVAAGEVADAVPFYETIWFWAVAAGAAIGLGVAGWVIYDRRPQLPSGDVPGYELP